MSYYYPKDTCQLKKEIRRIEKILKRGRINETQRELLEEDLLILKQDLQFNTEYA
jgi:hypothetical protein